MLSTSDNKPEDTSWPMGVMNKVAELKLIPDSMKNSGNELITREQMAMVLVNGAKELQKESVDGITFDEAKIGDLDKAGAEYQTYIKTAYGMGLLAGTGNG